MLPEFLRKGALCVAFAAAIGGLAGCNRGPKAPGSDVDYEQPVTTMTPPQAALRSAALEAETYQAHTEHLIKDLKAKKITQAEYDEGVRDDDRAIANLRSTYVGSPQLVYFDGFFKHELTKRGFTPPDKMPELPPLKGPQPVLPKPGDYLPATPVQKAPDPQATPGSQVILKALEPVINSMLADAGNVIGPEATNAALGGQTTREAVFPGGPVQNSTRLPASALKSGEKYFFNGKLTIDGNLPPNVTLNIRDGKLVLNGSAGAGDVINVLQPIVNVGGTTTTGGTHAEKYACWNNATGPSQDKPSDYSYHYGYRADGCTKDVPNAPVTSGGHDELKYKDADPAVKVTGTVAADAKINTNGGKVAVDGKTPATKPAVTSGARP